MQIVIPMAGIGKRFVDAGYALPKPLIPVGGVPMIVQVVRDLPKAERVICVCHPDHVHDFGIDRVLRQQIPGCHVIVTPGLTEGQACTVLLTAGEVDPAQPVLVCACDNTHLYRPERLNRLIDAGVECLIWGYRREPRVLVRPQWYGWVDADADGRVRRVSVKKPISDNPLEDAVVSGTFWFRSAGNMMERIRELVRLNRRVNNEFYLDSVPELLIRDGQDVRLFEVEKYIGWGTPDDVEDYQRWHEYITQQAASRAAAA